MGRLPGAAATCDKSSQLFFALFHPAVTRSKAELRIRTASRLKGPNGVVNVSQ